MSEGVGAVLRAKEAQVLAQMGHLTQPQQDRGSIGFGKRVGDGTAMAVDRLNAVSAHTNLGRVLAEVRRALAKVEAGDYGRCDVCGEPIGEGRLEARPWATTCIRHG